jgi:hypothetical protein
MLKLIVGIADIFWLVSALVGAWWREDVDEGLKWKAVARGPITLVHAFNEHPVTYKDHA